MSACTQAPATYTGAQLRTPTDKIPAGGEMKNFQLVAHNPLIESKFNLPRGDNGGGLTAIRDCLYVGSNNSYQPALVLDMKDMTKPTVVGEVPGIPFKAMGSEAFEGVADLNLLVNTTRTYPAAGSEIDLKMMKPEDRMVGMVVYDATDCKKPTIAAKVNVPNDSVHYVTLWRDPDPSRPGRVLAFLAFAREPKDAIDLRVYDLDGCPKSCNPKLVAEWSVSQAYGIPQRDKAKYDGGEYNKRNETHDVTPSLDGTRIHVAARQFGYVQLDSTALAKKQPCDPSAPKSDSPAVASVVKGSAGHCLKPLNPDMSKRLTSYATNSGDVHNIVKIPGRPYVVVANEAKGGCPFTGLQIAYVGDQESFGPGATGGTGKVRGDLEPRLVGIFTLPENQIDRCGPDGTLDPSFGWSGDGMHNVLVFPSVAFVGYNAAGLRAVDISNPYTPFELGYFFNKPVAEVRWGTGDLANAEVDAEGVPVRLRGENPPDIAVRSWPIAMNGHIVYADSDSGVYVLKYTGPHANQIPQKGICLSHNPNNVTVGYEPCAPYNDKTGAPAK